MTDTLTFYGDSISGNCYKLKLACAELDIDYDWQEMDILAGAARSEDFLKLNPNGKVPLMLLPDGRTLPESNAILSWLAEGTSLSGDDRYARANIQQWMCFEQYSHEPYIATSRFIVKYLGSPAARQADLESRSAPGYRALDLMEQHLSEQEFFANNVFSIADIALFAYTHLADEGGFDLSEYTAIRSWIKRIQDRPQFVGMC